MTDRVLKSGHLMKRVLILLELVCLFGPATAILSVGAIFLPPMLLATSSASRDDWLLGTALVVCGCWGIVSAANLAFHLVADRHWPGKPVQLFGLGLGVAACSISLFLVGASFAGAVFAAPIVATIHFVVLAKRRSA
ncbi:hypothetical protein E5198_01995 [Pseudomonas sp. A-1]|jgi:hypothetical protein|uniref:hypothetical protein n=1 Tax=Pseudomonas sp. A-1 TaxID=1821274 RepID=UPI0010A5EFEE|nr:hypothetical protein [Pseudomonas sp. A-1]THG86430.1 hypothetical protein E5198_01995 [Pseudomonas sp. A-1]